MEIYQNCNVFNDGAFSQFTEKEIKDNNLIFIEHGKPLIFGKEKDKGIKLNGFTPEIVFLKDGKYSVNDLLVHDKTDTTLSFILSDMTYNSRHPRPVGVFLAISKPTYEEEMKHQINFSIEKRGKGDVQKLFNSGDTWTIQ